MGKRGESLVAVYGSIAPEFEEEYNNWYNTHHVPPLLQVPGLLGVGRYRLVGGGSRYLTLYELEGASVLEHPTFRRMTDSPDDWDRRVTAQVKSEGRLVCNRLLAVGNPADLHAQSVVTTRMDVDPAMEEEFNNWYNTEHLPDLGGVPGVQSARRYQQLRVPPGGTWQYMAVYEFERDGVYGSEAWKKAAGTPWTRKMLPHIKNGMLEQWQCVFRA